MGEQLMSLAESWPWATESVAQLQQTMDEASDKREWHHPVVFGTLAAAAGGTSHEAVAVYLHQAALGVISAGVRAIPIGHTHGQQIVARLHHDLEALATELAGKGLETAGTFCPAYETLCHAQTRLYTRLFRS
jgi:urease accessory protein